MPDDPDHELDQVLAGESCDFCGGTGNLMRQSVGKDHQFCDGKIHGVLSIGGPDGVEVDTKRTRKAWTCIGCRSFLDYEQELDRGRRGSKTVTIHRFVRCPQCEPLSEGEKSATKLERAKYDLPPVEDE
jgi:hypothetical protein